MPTSKIVNHPESHTIRKGEVAVKAGGFEVGDGSEKGKVTEASGDAFGELEFAVDDFYGSVGYPALEVAEDSVPVRFAGAR